MSFKHIIWALFLSHLSGVKSSYDRPYIKTQLGEVYGDFRTSDDGKKFSAFEGIPYAKPPVGNRRFEEPEPIDPWLDAWEANFTRICAQSESPDLDTSQTIGEDCLYINIYVPTEEPDPETNFPVVVHIHGGAFMYGSGHQYANPQYLMDSGVILVTFNYRLGILGFLSTEDTVVPGNNGLKDQVLALKWIQQNIASFGGNPKSVTLTGVSAGGACVHLHYFSKMSEGLFHRGFSQSGVALNPFVLQTDALQKAQRLANAVGCPTSNTKLLVECLKQRPYEHLLEKIDLFFILPDIPPSPFAPVIEKEGEHPFLGDSPFRLLSKGRVQDLPWIASNTAHEGLFPLLYTFSLTTINNYWELLAPMVLYFDHVLPNSNWSIATEKIKEFYLNNQPVDYNNFLNFVQIFSDRDFLVDAEIAVRWQARMTESPVYYARFNYIGDDNENKTVAHAQDKRYYFGTNKKMLTSNELKMKDLITDMLVSYANTSKPEISGTTWEPTEYDELTFLNINGTEPEDLELSTVEDLTPRQFWRSLGFAENENLLNDEDAFKGAH